MQLKTRKGYDFFVATSALQKSIRRNKPEVAGFFAIELWESNYRKYVWKRLLTISAEDCAGIITKEIKALYDSYVFINTPKPKEPKGRIFVAKAVLILCAAAKCRDADHLTNLVYDKEKLSPGALDEFLQEVDKTERREIEGYVYDCHTRQGKKAGKTKENFFRDEFICLKPKQLGLFDSLVK